MVGPGFSPSPVTRAPATLLLCADTECEAVRARAREVFKLLDVDRDGLLDMDQMYDGLRLMGESGGARGVMGARGG